MNFQSISSNTATMLLIKLHLFAILAPLAESLLQYQRLNLNNKSIHRHRHHNRHHNNHDLQMRLNPTSFKGTDYIITEFPRPSLRRTPNAPISKFDDEFSSKTQTMLSIMYESKGVGLAAPQIGLNELVFVYNPSDAKDMERVVCNPTITKFSEDVIVEEEGCLSLRSDECAGQVARSEWIETEYQNELGQKVRRRLKGFEARVFQHEYDHLKGILCYDRFPPEDREAVQQSIDRLLGLYDEDDALIDPDVEEARAAMPRPLSARWMPPLESDDDDVSKGGDDDVDVVFQKQKAKKGVGGFGMGGGGKKAGNKKEKKKKVKVRNAARSDNPKFKTTGKTKFASRK
mmetsp:Transcript_4310/g.9667  ORF Transcript_4310/g.9667 Transcript_4310/m.9667 type:complete len:345 (+) Transcript_4310:163-1197(+)